MKLLVSKLLVAGLIAASIATPAMARRVAVDSNPLVGFTPCSFGSSCTPLDIGFDVNFGTGLTRNAYVYSNGLVSLGSPIAASSFPGTLAGLGSNVLTPAYLPGASTSGFGVASGTSTAFFFDGLFRVNFTSTAPGGDSTLVQFNLFQLTSAPGDFVLQYGYGDFNGDPLLNPATLIGYNLGTSSLATTAGLSSAAVLGTDSDNDGKEFQFYFRGGTVATVPEPSSWMLMILGFGLAGTVVRRRALAA